MKPVGCQDLGQLEMGRRRRGGAPRGWEEAGMGENRWRWH